MKSRWWAALAVFAAACSMSSGADKTVSSGARTLSPPSAPAISQAADLRTHIDLLLGEHVMIIAKETAAAANHSDEYASYTALLTTNETDLAEVMRNSFGNSSADDLARLWHLQNGYLVDYGIGVVTHNDNKSKAAIAALNSDFVPKLADLISSVSGLSTDQVGALLTQQAGADKTFIDDIGAQKWQSIYADLQIAYAESPRWGDALAARIAQKFPDKFPGDPTLPSVDRRVSLDLVLQQHAWLATMATEAVVAGREQDKTAASAALGLNEALISRSLSDQFGSSAANAFDKAWTARDAALLSYASKGDSDSKQALTMTASQFSSAAHIESTPVKDELAALIKVVDDQRAKSSKTIAGDDRAAATSMQPVGDAIATAA